MNAIWINIVIAITQIIITFAIGYWQISVAKSIARNEIGKKENLKTKWRKFLSKHFNTIIKSVFFFNIFIMISFLGSEKPPTRLDILYLVFVTASTVFVSLMYICTLLLNHMEKGYKLLYCMICNRSADKKPVCIEEIIKDVDQNTA